MRKISKANAEHYVWGERCDGWQLVQQGELSVIHERMPPGTAEERHLHRRARQFFFMLRGQAVMEADGETLLLAPGEGIEIPPGTAHQIRNESDGDIEFLVISQPTSRGDRFRA